MEACLQQHRVAVDLRHLYDLRYFYTDDNQIGHYTCGVAFEAMMSMLRQDRLARFCGREWYSAVERSDNPVVQGHLAEHICLSYIVTHGLSAVSTRLGRMSHSSFQEKPNWNQLLTTDETTRLYIPTTYNYRAVDGVILFLDHRFKQAHMYPIQITISMRHKKSDKDFYAEMWKEWVAPIEMAGFTIESTFVWIDRKQPSEQIEPALVKEFRSGMKIVRPDYRVIHIGIEQVDRDLANALDH